MAQPLSALTRDLDYRLVVIGPAKIGKTEHVVTTAPRPTRVVCCEHKSALDPARRRAEELGIIKDISIDIARDETHMLNAVVDAKKEAKAGNIKSLIIDPFTAYTQWLEMVCIEDNDNPDGRAAYRPYNQKGKHLVNLLMTVPCHVILICHFMEKQGKESKGKVPAIAGQLGDYVTTAFQNIVWMDLDTKGKGADGRMFVTGSGDFWGPGCRHGGRDLDMTPADVGFLFKKFAETGKRMKTSSREDDGQDARRGNEARR